MAAAVSSVPSADSTASSLADGRGTTRQAAATEQTARVGPLFSNDLNGGHFCTASVVRSPGHNTIVTAAHCLRGGTDVVFAPGFRNGHAPHGTWEVQEIHTSRDWDEHAHPDADLAFATLAPQRGRNVEDVVGAFPLTGTEAERRVTVIGYPKTLDVPLACTSKPTRITATQQRITCPAFSGGTSGSPWLTSDNAISGVLGGHQGGGTDPDVSYSIVLGATATDLHRNLTFRARREPTP